MQYAALEAKVAELQRELEALRIEYDRRLAALTAELQAAKIEIERLLEEMRRLFDQKIALELEITQYKKLLAMEDARYAACPSRYSHSLLLFTAFCYRLNRCVLVQARREGGRGDGEGGEENRAREALAVGYLLRRQLLLKIGFLAYKARAQSTHSCRLVVFAAAR